MENRVVWTSQTERDAFQTALFNFYFQHMLQLPLYKDAFIRDARLRHSGSSTFGSPEHAGSQSATFSISEMWTDFVSSCFFDADVNSSTGSTAFN